MSNLIARLTPRHQRQLVTPASVAMRQTRSAPVRTDQGNASARHLAVELKLQGRSPGEVERYLSEVFGFRNAREIVDLAFAA